MSPVLEPSRRCLGGAARHALPVRQRCARAARCLRDDHAALARFVRASSQTCHARHCGRQRHCRRAGLLCPPALSMERSCGGPTSPSPTLRAQVQRLAEAHTPPLPRGLAADAAVAGARAPRGALRALQGALHRDRPHAPLAAPPALAAAAAGRARALRARGRHARAVLAGARAARVEVVHHGARRGERRRPCSRSKATAGPRVRSATQRGRGSCFVGCPRLCAPSPLHSRLKSHPALPRPPFAGVCAARRRRRPGDGHVCRPRADRGADGAAGQRAGQHERPAGQPLCGAALVPGGQGARRGAAARVGCGGCGEQGGFARYEVLAAGETRLYGGCHALWQLRDVGAGARAPTLPHPRSLRALRCAPLCQAVGALLVGMVTEVVYCSVLVGGRAELVGPVWQHAMQRGERALGVADLDSVGGCKARAFVTVALAWGCKTREAAAVRAVHWLSGARPSSPAGRPWRAGLWLCNGLRVGHTRQRAAGRPRGARHRVGRRVAGGAHHQACGVRGAARLTRPPAFARSCSPHSTCLSRRRPIRRLAIVEVPISFEPGVQTPRSPTPIGSHASTPHPALDRSVAPGPRGSCPVCTSCFDAAPATCIECSCGAARTPDLQPAAQGSIRQTRGLQIPCSQRTKRGLAISGPARILSAFDAQPGCGGAVRSCLCVRAQHQVRLFPALCTPSMLPSAATHVQAPPGCASQQWERRQRLGKRECAPLPLVQALLTTAPRPRRRAHLPTNACAHSTMYLRVSAFH